MRGCTCVFMGCSRTLKTHNSPSLLECLWYDGANIRSRNGIRVKCELLPFICQTIIVK